MPTRAPDLLADLRQHQPRLRQNRAHGVEIMDHAVVADMLDCDAGREQLARIGIAFVAHRIEFGGVDDRGRQALQVQRAQRRDPGIGGIACLRADSRRGRPPASRGRSDGLRQIPRARARSPRNRAPGRSGIAPRSQARAWRCACWQTTAASVAPAESPPTTSLVASMPSEAALRATNSVARDRVLHRGRKFVLRREAIIDRDQPAAGGIAPAPPRRGHGSRCCRPPCRRHGRRRSRAGRRRPRCRRIEAIADVAGGARQGAVGRRDIGSLGAGELHQLGERLARARPRSAVSRAAGEAAAIMVRNRLAMGIERHGGSG